MVASLMRTTRRPTPRLASCAPTIDRAPAPTRMGYERGPRLTGISIMTGPLRPRLPAFEVLQVPLVVTADLFHPVPPQLLAGRPREHDFPHCLPHHPPRGGRPQPPPPPPPPAALSPAPSPPRQPRATTSKTPPSVSPAALARSMASIMAGSASGSAQRTSLASARRRISSHGVSSGPICTPPISVTWLRIEIPNSPSRRLATAATATRAVVSRALERSSTFRLSWCP